MATDSLIDQYLTAFGARVKGRRDSADLIAEVEDHLRSSAERLEELGIDPHVAEKRALARFGEPRLVASLVTSVPSKGSTMALFFSRHLAPLAAVAAILWIVAGVISYWGFTDADGHWTQTGYLLTTGAIIAACAVTTAALVGVNLRAVGSFDRPTIGIGILGVAATLAALISWVVAGWMTLLAIAVAWTLVRTLHARAGSRPFALVLLVAMPVLAVASVVATIVSMSTTSVADYTGWFIVLGVLAVVIAALIDIVIRTARRPLTRTAA